MIAPIDAAVDTLNRAVKTLDFGPPVAYVYNPLDYAGEGFRRYVLKFGRAPKEILLVGMNPGPWGMAQTGVPFGEIAAVRDWMGIEAPVGAPPAVHPKKPVDGFACPKSEPSGRRLWGWVMDRFGSPDTFFSRYFVANYCPLMFLDAEGRNRTPDKLRKAERTPLFAACDAALRDTVGYFRPCWVIGVGAFAEARARAALSGLDVRIGRITHPSPANPRANRGWAGRIESELAALGIEIGASPPGGG
jgi:single-strand selective monofunctional uracil DNA glycosylase